MKHYEGKDRYQFKPWYIKVMRWVRWRPWLALKSLYYVVRNRRWWIYAGMNLSYWNMGQSEADCNMGYMWTMDEVKEHLDIKSESPNGNNRETDSKA